MIDPQFAHLLLLFITNGYIQIAIASQVTRQIENLTMVGIAMMVFSLSEVLLTFFLGRVADHWGNKCMIVIATAFCIIASLSTMVMNTYQAYWVFVPAVLFAVVDTIYQTECISILGRYFKTDIENVSAIYRFIQGTGSSICSFITPLFSNGKNICNHSQLFVEMLTTSLLAVISCLLFFRFLKLYGEKN